MKITIEIDGQELTRNVDFSKDDEEMKIILISAILREMADQLIN